MRMCLFEYDVNPELDYTYWDRVEGDLTIYQEGMEAFGISEKAWIRITNFIMMVI